MGGSHPLFVQFCEALNAEIKGCGCALRVAPGHPDRTDQLMLLGADGEELGWLPDHVDAVAIAAFGRILDGARKSDRSGAQVDRSNG